MAQGFTDPFSSAPRGGGVMVRGTVSFGRAMEANYSVTVEPDEELGTVIEELRAASAGTGDERGDTRERIISAAIRYFSSEGFQATSVRKLSEAVDITPAGLYSHFATKEAVLVAAITRVYFRFLTKVVVPSDSPGETSRLLGLCRRHMEFQVNQRTYASWSDVTLDSSSLEALLPTDILTLMQRAQLIYFRMIQSEIESVREDESLDTRVETEAILSLCDSVAWGPRNRFMNSAAFVDQYLVLIGRILGRSAPGSS